MRSQTSRGVPKWSGGKELYMGSRVSAIGKVSGFTGIVPEPPEGSRGPPGGATYPGGPHGLKWEGNQPLVGWCAPPLGPPAPRVGNPRVGGRTTCLGGHSTPLGRRPPRDPISRAGAPLGAYIKEGGGRVAAPLSLGASLSPATPIPLVVERRSPAAVTPASTTTPSCCWIFINLSVPLARSRRRRRHTDRTCVERGGAVRSALGSPVIWITT